MFNFFEKKPSRLLNGQELIDKVKELRNSSKTDIAIACGYVDKRGHVMFSDFYEAILLAKGKKSLGLDSSRKLSYIATVQGNGNLLIGKPYTAMMDLQPGDQVEIKLGKNDITLTRMGPLEDPWFH